MDPTSWSAEVVLADGGPVHVRPIDPSDAEAYEAFHDRQSDESIYYRYFSARPKLSRADLERICTVDMVDRAALVAVEGDELIGIASYDRWPGRNDAEVAFFVDDAHHGRGLATVLLEHLAVVARSNGIERFTAEVLADNRAMLGVFMKAGWPVQRAFDSGVIDVVFPLETTSGLVDSIERREQVADARSLSRLLFPRTVAVIGASDVPGSPGWAMFRNLLRSGFPGPVFPVNPHRPHVASVACVPSVSAIDGPVDLAVVLVPPGEVRAVVEDCAAKRVRGLILCTELSTAEPPVDLPDLVQFVRRHGMRMIGPGSMGVLATGAAPLWAHLAYVEGQDGIPPGGVAVSLQSGALGASVLDLARRLRIGLSTFVSLGEKADVSGNDLLQYAEEDASTAAVAMYTESFGNPRKFARIARRVAMKKPIVAVRAGPTGDLPSVEALYQQAGVIPVASVRDLLDTARVLATQPLPSGRRVGVVTNARNPAKLAVDALRRQGLVAATLAGSTWEALGSTAHVVRDAGDPVLDLTWRATPSDYRAALSAVLDDPGVDAVLVIHAPPVPQALQAPAEVIDEVAAGSRVPVLAVMLGRDEGPVQAGSAVPAFAFPEPAAAILGRAARLAEWRARRAEDASDEQPLDDIDQSLAASTIAKALAARPEGTLLHLQAMTDLLRAVGIQFAHARNVTSLDDALAAADDLGYPVCLKALGAPRRGVGAAGGVRLDLQDRREVELAWSSMSDLLGDRALAEAMVQRMVPSGVDVRVTTEIDPALGPLVTVGLGGVHSGAIGDRVARLAPLGPGAAAEAVAQSRASAALAALGIDPGPLVDLVSRIGSLVDEHPEVDRVDLNPIIVTASGAFVVDGTIHVAPSHRTLADVPVRRL
jgi:acyl-CoA synthetase (NDP forming)/RimJ/RimL family protein N-acetyltransferase